VKEIKKIKIFYNENEKSKEVYNILVQKLKASNLEIVEEGQQLSIAIGGDGSFIRMLKQSNYSSNMLYVGINTGTLGFLQEIEVSELDELISGIKQSNYIVCKTAIQKNTIKTQNEERSHYAFNEIVIRRADLSLTKLDVLVDDINIERFVGDALMVTTSVGSTAHASSYGSAIVHDGLYTLQIVSAGAFNSVINQTLKNPIILPTSAKIKILPLKVSKNFLLTIDGENYDYKEVESITTVICSKKINRLRLNNKNFYKKVNSKFVRINN
jgi:NAD+ kinase